jgi:hypothetical protein
MWGERERRRRAAPWTFPKRAIFTEVLGIGLYSVMIVGRKTLTLVKPIPPPKD